MGERFAVALAHGTMSTEYYAPIGVDPQTPHEQDEVYFIHKGIGELVIRAQRHSFEAGDCLFVAADVEHRFENFPLILEHGLYSWDLEVAKAAKAVVESVKGNS